MLRWPIRDEIYLRLPEERDVEELLRLIESNRDRLEEWMHWAHSTHTTEDLLQFVQRARRDFQKPTSMEMLIFERREIIGSCALKINEQDSYAEIGYWIGRAFAGRGIITECCRALIDYAFDELGLNRVQVRCAAGNTRSAAIAKRLGFKHEGTRRQALRTGLRLDDEDCYGLLKSDRQQV